MESHNKYISYGAAQSGNIELLEWVMSHGCGFNSNVCTRAAQAGQLDVLKWLASKMDYWSQDFSFKSQVYILNMCVAAAGGGHIHVLDWLFNNIKQTIIHPQMATKAARNGQLGVLNWIFQRSTSKLDYVNVCSAAARGGHMDVLLWARKHNFPWSSDTCAKAASGGHLDIIKWLREQGCPMDNTVLINAGKKGHLNILQLALSIGIAFPREVCGEAAYGGQLHILKWLKENELPWVDEWLRLFPQNANYLEALKWAKSIGYNFQEYNYIKAAGNLEALQWLKDNNCPWSEHFLWKVAKKGNAEAIKFGLENNCPWDDRLNCDNDALWTKAGEGGSVEVIVALANFEKPSHLAWHEIGIYASAHGHLDAMKFVLKNEAVSLDILLDNAADKDEESLVTHLWLLKQLQ